MIKIASGFLPLAVVTSSLAFVVAARNAVAAPLRAGNGAVAFCDSSEDRDALAHLPRESIEDVQPLYESREHFGALGVTTSPRSLTGATIAVRPMRGLSQERLQHLVECSFANAAADVTATDWPRLPAGTTVQVRSGGDRFIVELRAADGVSPEAIVTAAKQYAP
jgi:hypothetical protein